MANSFIAMWECWFWLGLLGMGLLVLLGCHVWVRRDGIYLAILTYYTLKLLRICSYWPTFPRRKTSRANDRRSWACAHEDDEIVID